MQYFFNSCVNRANKPTCGEIAGLSSLAMSNSASSSEVALPWSSFLGLPPFFVHFASSTHLVCSYLFFFLFLHLLVFSLYFFIRVLLLFSSVWLFSFFRLSHFLHFATVFPALSSASCLYRLSSSRFFFS